MAHLSLILTLNACCILGIYFFKSLIILVMISSYLVSSYSLGWKGLLLTIDNILDQKLCQFMSHSSQSPLIDPMVWPLSWNVDPIYVFPQYAPFLAINCPHWPCSLALMLLIWKKYHRHITIKSSMDRITTNRGGCRRLARYSAHNRS